MDHSFMLQVIMEPQKSVVEIGTKTDRLIDDVKGHGAKIDILRLTIARWTGVILVVAIIIPIFAKFGLDWILKP